MCSGVRGVAGLRQPAAPALGSVHLPRGRPRRLVAVEAANRQAALALLPPFVAHRTDAIAVRDIQIP